MRFSIIATVFEPLLLLPRLIACVSQQTHRDWELLLFVDGPSPRGAFHPRRILTQARKCCPEQRIELWELPRAAGCFGNIGRHEGLKHARGAYVCWVNHDNLIAPEYLAAHCENIERRPGCLSVVDVELWKRDRYYGRYPRRFACGGIDLLCFAVPLATAQSVNAFGGEMSRIYAADWLVFDACRRELPLEHNRRLVGTHF